MFDALISVVLIDYMNSYTQRLTPSGVRSFTGFGFQVREKLDRGENLDTCMITPWRRLQMMNYWVGQSMHVDVNFLKIVYDCV